MPIALKFHHQQRLLLLSSPNPQPSPEVLHHTTLLLQPHRLQTDTPHRPQPSNTPNLLLSNHMQHHHQLTHMHHKVSTINKLRVLLHRAVCKASFKDHLKDHLKGLHRGRHKDLLGAMEILQGQEAMPLLHHLLVQLLHPRRNILLETGLIFQPQLNDW